MDFNWDTSQGQKLRKVDGSAKIYQVIKHTLNIRRKCNQIRIDSLSISKVFQMSYVLNIRAISLTIF